MRQSHSPTSQGEYHDFNSVKREYSAVPSMPKTVLGVFENDPQLGVDFILQYAFPSLGCSDVLTKVVDSRRHAVITENILCGDP